MFLTRVALCIVLTYALLLAGCSRLRFVIDAVPAQDDLTETVVMEDPNGLKAIGRDKIALIDVTGLIADAHRPGLFVPGENPVARFVEALQRAAADNNVKAVIVRINSPGGTVTASDIMHRELVHFRQTTKKPAIISMGDVAASGGYYLACAGDVIVAHPTTVTGSIGVIIQTVNVSEGLRRIGVRADAITSGPNKAMGSPFEPMPEEHRKLLQGLVDEFYANFTTIVTDSRKDIDTEDLQWITDGRVISGRRAAEVGLVDQLGDLRDAFEVAKSRAGLKAAKLVKYHRPLEHVGSAYAAIPGAPAPGAGAGGTQINLMQFNLGEGFGESPGFYYLWDPSVW